jgi:hypothetical protein
MPFPPSPRERDGRLFCDVRADSKRFRMSRRRVPSGVQRTNVRIEGNAFAHALRCSEEVPVREHHLPVWENQLIGRSSHGGLPHTWRHLLRGRRHLKKRRSARRRRRLCGWTCGLRCYTARKFNRALRQLAKHSLAKQK